jgi:Xaa-Pro aminopeptidase
MSSYDPTVLQDIRAYLRHNGLKALLVTHSDAHASEYIAERDERLAFVSNFTGSAGNALITLDKALLWTDGRYFTQAAKELYSPEWQLMKSGEKDVPSLETYLSNLANGCSGIKTPAAGQIETEEENQTKRHQSVCIIGVDAETVSIKQCERIQSASEKLAIDLIHPSFINQIWEKRGTRPSFKRSAITFLPLSITGKSVQDKIEMVTKQLGEKKCDVLVVSALDDIAWLLNARGQEIPFNPVFFAHIILKSSGMCIVYTDHAFAEYRPFIVQRSYDSFLGDLRELFTTSEKIWIDPANTSGAFLQGCVGSSSLMFKDLLEQTKPKLLQSNTCIKMEKPKKTGEEIEAMKRGQISDGAALCKFLAAISHENFVKHHHDEVSLSEWLEEFRKNEDEAYAGKSFETISSFAENGAIVHYKPKLGSCKKIEGSNVYLVDSGGHYSYGATTDTTRTVWLGPNVGSDLFKEAQRCYTYVLKGHVALARMTFPSGVLPQRLDGIPRAELWAALLDYQHGTGHGVGSWLCVHELPPLISSADAGNGGLYPTMCVTNEPGYYLEGKFGFRIENLMFVVEVPENPKFSRFETITLVPYCRELIDVQLLTAQEIEWIDAYHQKCRQMLLDRIKMFPKTLEWFNSQTQPLSSNK